MNLESMLSIFCQYDLMTSFEGGAMPEIDYEDESLLGLIDDSDSDNDSIPGLKDDSDSDDDSIPGLKDDSDWGSIFIDRSQPYNTLSLHQVQVPGFRELTSQV